MHLLGWIDIDDIRAHDFSNRKFWSIFWKSCKNYGIMHFVIKVGALWENVLKFEVVFEAIALDKKSLEF